MIATRTLAAALAAALLPLAAAAEDVSDLAGLLNESVVSTASKAAETAGAAPATTSVITAEDLRRYGFTTLDQAINFLGLGMLAERSYGTPEIGARGVLLTGDFGNHVLLLLDGHALNEPWDATAYYDQTAGIPLDMVDHIEVILGPGSVLYGSSAMLGVIHVITRRAADYAGLHLVTEGGVPWAAHLAAGYGRPFEWGGRSGGLTVGLDLHQTWGPNATYAIQPYGSGTWGGDARHRQVSVPSGYLRLEAGDFHLSLRSAQSRRAATAIWGDFDAPDNWERDRWLSLDARWSAAVADRVQLGVRVYGDLYDYLENDPTLDCQAGQTACVFRNSGVSRWAGVEGSASFDWAGDGRFQTLVGADARWRHVTSWSAFDDPATGTSTRIAPYDRTDGSAGAYLQQTASPTRWLALNAGLRFDRDGSATHLSPRLAVVVPPWPGGTVKAIYAEAFRAPSFYERYYSDNLTQLAAPHLAPETVRSVEGVVEQRFGAQRARLAVFTSWWSDMVLLVPATPEQIAGGVAAGALPAGTTDASVYGNASRIRSTGLNADWEGSALGQRLRYGLGFTLARARRDGTERLAAAAQAFGNARASYDPGGRLPAMALAIRFTGPRSLAGSEADPVPESAAAVDVQAALSGSAGAGLGWRLAGTWSSSRTAAYAVGPARDLPGAVLPAPRFQLLLGLRWDGP